MMKNLTLDNIARVCHGTYIGDEGARFTCIESITTDSRKIETGCLFVPIVGARVDGHNFIAQVMEQGAMCTLSEIELGTVAYPYIKVESSMQAVKDIAQFYLEQLDIPVVGITGSVGKTSTKEMIASVLEQKYRVLKTLGNFNNELGLPLTIFRLREEDEVAVLEMGISDFGEMSRLAKIAKPDIAVITNIGICHLENLGDRDGVLKAKTEIFEYMKEKGQIILNGDDDKLATVGNTRGIEPIFFGINNKTAYYADEVQNLGLKGIDGMIHTPSTRFSTHIQIPGYHMIYNALAATAVGEKLGLTAEEIKAGIAACAPVDGRNNIIEAHDRIIIDDCYNANPISMRSGIDVLTQAVGRKVAILGDMGELGSDEKELHYEVGTYVSGKEIDVLLAVGELCQEMAIGASMEADKTQVYHFSNKEELLEELDKYVEKGDTILVKASHFMGFEEVVKKLTK